MIWTIEQYTISNHAHDTEPGIIMNYEEHGNKLHRCYTARTQLYCTDTDPSAQFIHSAFDSSGLMLAGV